MSRWMQERLRDHYFQKARREGYRARAAYKLKQINRRYQLIRRGDLVVDLGCAPGSWLQVAAEIVGSEGQVIGIDLLPVNAVPGAEILQGDMLEPETLARLDEILDGREPQVILSDMAPNISGNRLRDHLQSLQLAEIALDLAQQRLSAGGAAVIKVFEGGDLPEFLSRMRTVFAFCKPHVPKASRAPSSETYLIGREFRGPRGW